MTRRLDLAVQYATRSPWVPERPAVRGWVRAALDADGPCAGRITVRFVDEDEGRRLNRDFRHQNHVTNVLSFPYAPPPEVAGDLVLVPAVCAAEAATQGKTIEAHMAHLVVHGILHLLGYDHGVTTAALKMEKRERELLAALGYSDPYAVPMPSPVKHRMPTDRR